MSSDGMRFIIDCRGADADSADLPIDALSLGRGVFETMLVASGTIAFRDEHLSRLTASCVALGIAKADSVESLFAAAEARIGCLKPMRARMRLAVFAGNGGSEPVALVAASDAVRVESVSLWLSPERRAKDSLLARHKTVDYLGSLLAREEARRHGFDDALIMDTAGNIAETTTANVFFHIDGALITPRLDCILPGVVRAWVLSTAGPLGMSVGEDAVPEAALSCAHSAFVTNSVIGLVPVSRIGDRALGDVSAADWFVRLRSAYDMKASKTTPG